MSVLRTLGYVVFFLFAFALGVYWTFPYDVAKDQVLREVSKEAKMNISADSLEPNWFTGAVLRSVTIEPRGVEQPIELSTVTVRAHLLPMLTGGRGVTVDAPFARGNVHADLVITDEGADIDGTVKGVEIALVPGLTDATGLRLSGELDLDVDLLATKNPKASQGLVKLKAAGLTILQGGKVGSGPMTVTIPEDIVLGSFEWEIPIKDGEAQFEQLELKGGDIDLRIDGSIRLANPIRRSELRLEVAFKPAPALLQRIDVLGPALMAIRRAKGKDDFYAYSITGSVERPNRPRPVRRRR